jgi:hypothetical protein
MFELKAAIDRWREQAAASGITGDALAELEDHLRQDVANLVAHGRNEQEAWRLAIVKLGDPAALAPQFHAVERLSTLDRAALGLILVTITGFIATGLGLVAVRGPFRADWLLTVHVIAITLGYGIGLAAAPLAAWCTLRTMLTPRPLPRLNSVAIEMIRAMSLLAAASTVLGFVLGSLWSAREWNRFFSADVKELGALAIAVALSLAAYTATRRRYSYITLATALAAAGLIMGFWFGPIADEQGYPPLFTTLAFGGLTLGLALAALTLACLHRRGEVAVDRA